MTSNDGSSSGSNSALEEFFAECDEIIHRVSSGLQLLEKGEASPEVIDQIYRDMHTMKGSAQLFGVKSIGQLAHMMEAVLDPIRKRNFKVEVSFVDTALKTLDLIDRIARSMRSGVNESEFEGEVLEYLPRLVEEAAALFGADFRPHHDESVEQGAQSGAELKAALPGFGADSGERSLAASEADLAVPPASPASSAKVSVTAASPPSPVVEPVRAPHATGAKALAVESPQRAVSEEKTMSVSARSEQVANREESSQETQQSNAVESALAVQPENKATESKGGPPDTTIRVQVELLDRLMNLVGELVLVRNQVTQYSSRHDELEFLNMAQSLSVVTTELQNEVMLTRMQPIGVVVNKFQRVVRDLARDLGKKIDLTLQGAETELDKTLLEAIKDPLTHIVRNACDHGIETPEERRTTSKPDSGHLMIRAFHDGGQVFIEVSDDGRGLDRERILQKAIERKILTADRAAKMSDREINQIIFLPGFSTAKQVTNVSGRGVGMDVVKTNIEKIGGSVEVVSSFRKGSTVRIKIPLTLAIVPALLVRRGGERFAIPQVKLVELVRVDPAENRDHIEMLQGRPMYRLRGDLLPIVSLDEALKKQNPQLTTQIGAPELEADRYRKGIANIVVLSAEGEMFGLLVDEILDTADIVVKPLSSVLKKIAIFSGATILGDGGVALILDVMGLAESARIDTKSQRRSEEFMDNTKAANPLLAAESQELLLVRVNASAVHAIPLCLVQRLEEFPGNSIEISGAQQVVRYRDSILPIIRLNRVLGYGNRQPEQERSSVVVVQRAGRSYGIAVDEVLDVITTDRPIDDGIRDRAGIMGNVLLRDEVVVVVDAMDVIERELGRLAVGPSADPGAKAAIETIRKVAAENRAHKTRVLFAEDVPFFRKQVSKVLMGAGYEVVAVEDGVEALKALETSREGDFQLILSDIEMPNKTGLELARDVRGNSRFDKIPMVALTTRYREKDIADGKSAGFDAYLEKLNSEVLLGTLRNLLANAEVIQKQGTGT